MVAKISNASCPRSRIKLSLERARQPYKNSRLEILPVLENNGLLLGSTDRRRNPSAASVYLICRKNGRNPLASPQRRDRGETQVFYNKYPADKLHTILAHYREERAHFYFCRHAEFMVDEWSFEFLPGNSSLIFRIILPSNFTAPLGSRCPRLNDFPLFDDGNIPIEENSTF